MSNMAISDIKDVQVMNSGLALKMSDTVNNTFYNMVHKLMAFGCTRGIELNGSTPTNHNYFTACRVANRATGGDYGIYIGNAQ